MICLLRRSRMTAAEIDHNLKLPRSTVMSILQRIGLGKLAIIEPKVSIRRYERKQPGDMIHLDIKKLARFDQSGNRVKHTPGGWR